MAQPGEPTREPEAGSGPGTITSLLARQVRVDGDAKAYVLLDGAEQETETLTWSELETASRLMASVIGERAEPGERALLCQPHGLGYVAAFFACLRAGVTPVPAHPPWPTGPRNHLERIQTIAADCEAAVCLVPRGSSVEDLDLSLPAVLEVALPEAFPAADEGAASWRDAEVGGDDPAFLMYTSGSTGTPKGVEISHGNVLHNLSRFPFGGRPCRRIVSWLPFYHDLGLMLGVLHPLFQGVTSILLSPFSFAQDPLRWLRAISRYHATTSGSPNFAFDYCVRSRTAEGCKGLDLGQWNLALNGSEPVRAGTLDRFVDAFAPYGFRREAFYPSYGLSDATATVSAPREATAPLVRLFSRDELARGRVVEVDSAGGDARRMVGCGESIDDQEIVIVDPETREPLPPATVGEIWISGPSIGRTVWRRPEATRDRLQARLASGRGTFLRTGDLGFLHEGELFFTGRLDDLLVIQGVNHNPEEIEPVVSSCHPSLRPGCAAAVMDDQAEDPRLVILSEVRSVEGLDSDSVIRSIRTAVAENLGLEVGEVGLLPAGTILKTSSGKIRRRRCREEYAAGQLPVAGRWKRPEAAPAPAQPTPTLRMDGRASPATVEAWMVAHLAGRLGVPPGDIDVSKPLRDFGVHSLEAVGLAVELEKHLGLPLPPTLAWEFPTLQAIARHVAESARGSRGPAGRLAHEGLQDEPIAIVGMGCRFPGADGPDEFWDLLARGGDSIGEAPPDRWDTVGLYDPDPAAPGKMVSRYGGFLDGLELFDAEFFNITPREAAHLDPRQRLILETTYEAFEDAGLSLPELAGSKTGVYVAVLSNDYDHILYRRLDRVEAYSGTGTANSVVANRLSYVFDLAGPSMALDTACSGSLTAIHLACQALRSSECEQAVAGGVSVNLLPNGNILFSKAGALSPRGRCHTFDHRADGIVRSDGAGVLILKTLSRALRDKDRIHAVIRASALNQDGRSNGMMAPNGAAQEAVLHEAYRRAGVSPGRVQYVEAHGTGTALGDPIEVRALGAVLQQDRPSGSVCALGSLKTNLGHMEAAAGVASVIKVILSMRERRIPPSIHFERPNPLISFSNLPLRIQTELGSWPSSEDRLIAGISAFGFGGSNGHLVLEEPPAQEAAGGPALEQTHVLTLSAANPEGLEALASRTLAKLEGELEGGELRDLCYTAAVRRTHHRSRLAVAVGSISEAAQELKTFLDGQHPDAASEERVVGRRSQPVFVYSGQGAHWSGMGRDLWESEAVFRSKLLECDQLFRKHTDRSLVEELYPSDGAARSNRSDIAQAAVFGVQVALTALWSAWGIEPVAVVGQSLGEVAAAHCAGALSLEDAVAVVHHRSRLMQGTSGSGRTAVVGLPRDQAELLLAGLDDEVEIAGSLSPESTVLAGQPAALERLGEPLGRRRVFFRLIEGVDVAFHSRQMEPLRRELVDSLSAISPRRPEIPLFSSVLADEITDLPLDGEYWGRNLREPFRFGDTIERILGRGLGTFLEISAHPVLGGALRQCSKSQDGTRVLASLRRDRTGRREMQKALCRLYMDGQDVRWSALFPDHGRLLPLPRYPWQKRRFWFDQIKVQGASMVSPGAGTAPHPLLHHDWQSSVPPASHYWQSEIGPNSLHYLDDHQVEGMTVLPGAALLEMALFAGRSASGSRRLELHEVRFRAAMILSADRPRTCQLTLLPQEDGTRRFRISSRLAEGGWTLHAEGELTPLEAEEPPPRRRSPSAAGSNGSREIAAPEHYRLMSEIGLQYGSGFRAVQRIVAAQGEASGELELAGGGAEASAYELHPVLLDAILQLGAAADGYLHALWPVGLERLRLWRRPNGRLSGHCRMRQGSEDESGRLIDYQVFNETGEPVVEIVGLRLEPRREGSLRTRARTDPFYELRWTPSPQGRRAPGVESQSRRHGTWLVLADRSGLGERLGARLRETGLSVVQVRAGDEYVPPGAGDGATLDPGRSEDFARLATDLAELDLPDVQGVVHLWSLDDRLSEETTVASLEAAQGRGCQAIAYLVRHLADLRHRLLFEELSGSPAEDPLRLWIVTQGVQGDRPARLESAPLWGASRVLAHEHPDIWGGIVDLSMNLPKDEAVERLLMELLSGDGEDHVQLQPEARLVQRLVQSTTSPDHRAPVTFRRDCSYLVVGGFGGIGMRVAQWMVERDARRLILMTREPLPPRSQWASLGEDHDQQAQVAAVRRLESLGAEVLVAAVDVTDRERLRRFLREYRQEGRPPIRGVIHSAAVVSDRVLSLMDRETMMKVLAPKVLGGWNLHESFREVELDFFVLFSSIASFMGLVGQGNYAAANAFLDVLAHHRRSNGLPATSIDWGSWAEVGLLSRLGLEAEHRRQGQVPLTPERGLELFSAILKERPVQKVVMDVDWQRLGAALFGSPSPLLTEVLPSGPRRAEPGRQEQDEVLRRLLAETQTAKRLATVEQHVRELVAEAIRLDVSKVPAGRPLHDLGIDSVVTAEIQRRIFETLEVTIPISVLLLAPGLEHVAARIEEEIERPESGAPEDA